MGGLGLCDPLDINKEMGPKIWWKWITHQEESWAKPWHETYASHWPKKIVNKIWRKYLRFEHLEIGSGN